MLPVECLFQCLKHVFDLPQGELAGLSNVNSIRVSSKGRLGFSWPEQQGPPQVKFMAGDQDEVVAWGGADSLGSLQEQGQLLGSMLGKEQPNAAWSIVVSGASTVQQYNAGEPIIILISCCIICTMICKYDLYYNFNKLNM